MDKYNKLKQGYNKLSEKEKYIFVLIIIEYWEEKGISIEKKNKIFPKDVNFKNSKEYTNELKFLKNTILIDFIEINKVFLLFKQLSSYYKINFIVDKFLILNKNIISNSYFKDKLLEYAYNLMKYQKYMILNEII